MALIQVAYELIEKTELMDALSKSFDKFEEVHDDTYHLMKVFRVQHPEVPKEDKIIAPTMYKFDGVRPFILNYDDQY